MQSNFYKIIARFTVLTVLCVIFGTQPQQALGQALTQEQLQAQRNFVQTNEAQGIIDEAPPFRYSSITPMQNTKEPSPVVDTIGQCLGDMLANMATNWFSGFANTIVSTLAKPTLVPVYIPGFESKEVATAGGGGPSLDAIGYCIGNALIKTISDNTIKWINSGFEGNPVFIDDPEWFLKELKKGVIDDTLDSFVDSFADGILCKNFEIRATLSIADREKARRKYKCTYDEVLENLDRGVFTVDAYAKLTQTSYNNPMGAFLAIDSNYNEVFNSKRDAFNTEKDWGRGYLSWKDKNDPKKTVTPGKVVADQAARIFNFNADRTILADEFDEIMGALINQLVSGFLTKTLGS